jgi:ubiquinone/menaquinone biosynthesis C-methylase UbiE
MSWGICSVYGGGMTMLKVAGDNYHPTGAGVMQFENSHRYALSSQCIAGKNVLHIGSGEGDGSRLLAQAATSVIGIDYDRDIVERAKRAHSSIDNLNFVQGSYDALPLEDQSMDVVVAFEAFEQYDEILGEIKRVLRPNGLLF